MFALNLCHGTQSTSKQNQIIALSTVVIVNFEQMAPCSGVSTVVFEHVFIFWVWSFNISIIFWLRWIQAPFINRKDFLEGKYLHEVAYTIPCVLLLFFFFQFFFQNFQTEACKHYFIRTSFINYSGVIFQGKPIVTFSGKNFIGAQFSGDSCSGRNYSGKNVWR